MHLLLPFAKQLASRPYHESEEEAMDGFLDGMSFYDVNMLGKNGEVRCVVVQCAVLSTVDPRGSPASIVRMCGAVR